MPPTTGTDRARQASAMPSMASDSCHITSGCSGLPKLQQLTRATGRPPTHATLSVDSATTQGGPGPRVERAPAGVAVRRQSQTRAAIARRGDARCGQPQEGGVAARSDHGVQEQLVVVLPVDPRGVHEQGQQVGSAIRRWRHRRRVIQPAGGEIGRLDHGPLVSRGVVVKGRRRDVGEHLAVPTVQDPQLTGSR